MRFDARNEDFELVELFEKKVLFCDCRIDRGSVPDGIYMYEIRHGDEDICPCELCDWVMVNFFGTILSKEPFHLEPYMNGKNAYRDIDWENDWNMSGYAMKLVDYISGRE